eukprot:TRINITY_DN57713_c0_g1_i1.p1 TRINITY_DN57713_c0_g1~~TRINITY_DN57713_c0_g1_i1.p1  ORF type:complete len:400 (-),score=94.87 TRINITY_DN57713_c0_g1_i1:371-1570(-)
MRKQAALLQTQLGEATAIVYKTKGLQQESEALRGRLADMSKELENERASFQAKLDESSARHATEMHDMRKHAALLQSQLDGASANLADADGLKQESERLRSQIADMSTELDHERASVQAKLDDSSKRHAEEMEVLKTKFGDAAKNHACAVDDLSKERDGLQERLAKTVQELAVVQAKLEHVSNAQEMQECASADANNNMVAKEELRSRCAELEEQLGSAAQSHADEMTSLKREHESLQLKLDDSLRAHAAQMEELRRENLQGQAHASKADGDHGSEVEALRRENASLQMQLEEFSKTCAAQLESLEEAATSHLEEMEANHAAEIEALRGKDDQSVVLEKQDLRCECDRLQALLRDRDEVERANLARIKELRSECEELREELDQTWSSVLNSLWSSLIAA